MPKPAARPAPPHPLRPPRYVMLETTAVSPEQVLAFAQYVSGGRSFGQYSRPVQPLNSRQITSS